MIGGEFFNTAFKYYCQIILAVIIFSFLTSLVDYIKSLPPESMGEVCFTIVLIGINILSIGYIMVTLNPNFDKGWYIVIIGLAISVIGILIEIITDGQKITNVFLEHTVMVNLIIIGITYPLIFAYLKCTYPKNESVILKEINS
jgi:steroid 5-alpha reductase family enzyme